MDTALIPIPDFSRKHPLLSRKLVKLSAFLVLLIFAVNQVEHRGIKISLARGELPYASREPFEFSNEVAREMKAKVLKAMSWMLGKRLRLTGHSANFFKLDLVDHDDLYPGDQIAVFVDYNDYLSFLHHGIYIGNGTVIDVNNNGVHNISLTDFYGSEPLFKVNYRDWVRQRAAEEVVETALYHYRHPGHREGFSMVYGWNCETFATYCKTGVNATSQYADLVLTWVKTFVHPVHDTALRLTQERYRTVFAKDMGNFSKNNTDFISYAHPSILNSMNSFLDWMLDYVVPSPTFFT